MSNQSYFGMPRGLLQLQGGQLSLRKLTLSMLLELGSCMLFTSLPQINVYEREHSSYRQAVLC